MGYLIPKSARNVKMQLFKGLGIVEAVMVIVAVVIGVFGASRAAANTDDFGLNYG